MPIPSGPRRTFGLTKGGAGACFTLLDLLEPGLTRIDLGIISLALGASSATAEPGLREVGTALSAAIRDDDAAVYLMAFGRMAALCAESGYIDDDWSLTPSAYRVLFVE